MSMNPNIIPIGGGQTSKQMPNPMADMIEEAVGAAIEERLRKVVQEELKPVIELATTVKALMLVISAQRGKFAKLLNEAMSEDG